MEETKETIVNPEPEQARHKSWWQEFIKWQNLLVIVVMMLFLFLSLNTSNYIDQCNRHWVTQAQEKGWLNPSNFTTEFEPTKLYIGGYNGS